VTLTRTEGDEGHGRYIELYDDHEATTYDIGAGMIGITISSIVGTQEAILDAAEMEQVIAAWRELNPAADGGGKGQPCPQCAGSGAIIVTSFALFGDGNVTAEQHPCLACGGTGRAADGDGKE